MLRFELEQSNGFWAIYDVVGGQRFWIDDVATESQAQAVMADLHEQGATKWQARSNNQADRNATPVSA